MFGPREQLLTSEQPVVKQFLSGDRFGPIGMSEEKDEAVQKQEEAMQAAGIGGGGTKDDFSEIIPQVQPNPGMPERKAIGRHRDRVLELLPTLPENAQRAIRESMDEEDRMREETRAHEQDTGQQPGGQHAAGEWTQVQQGGGVAVADQKTDVINYQGNQYQGGDYQGSDAPTQQWVKPDNSPTTSINTDRGDVPGHEGRAT